MYFEKAFGNFNVCLLKDDFYYKICNFCNIINNLYSQMSPEATEAMTRAVILRLMAGNLHLVSTFYI